MALSEHQNSWRKTTELLREARSHLSEAAEGICADEIAEFEDYLNHNELELALDSLEAAVFKSPFETLHIVELLIAAAESMNLERHVARYRAEIESAHRQMEKRWEKKDSQP